MRQKHAWASWDLNSEQWLKRNKEAKRSASDTLQWALGEGIGDQLSLADPSGVAVAEKLYCQLCGTWLGLKGAILKDHCLGKNVKQPDGTFSRWPCSQSSLFAPNQDNCTTTKSIAAHNRGQFLGHFAGSMCFAGQWYKIQRPESAPCFCV